MKKYSLRILLCLVLALVLAFGFSSAAFAEAETAPADEPAAIDMQLVGEWTKYDIQNNGSVDNDVIDLIRNMDFILPTGVFTPSYYFASVNAAGLDQLTASAADGKTDLGQRLLDYVVMLSEIESFGVDASYAEEAGKLRDVEISYEIFDFKPEDTEWLILTDNMKALFEENTKDGLRLHVTGKYVQDPLTTKTVDVTYSFYADVPGSDFFEALFCGDWTDQNGNAWHFGYVFDEEGSTDFAFQLTTADGAEYVGEDFYAFSRTVEGEGIGFEISFDFDSFSSPDYKLMGLDASSVTLSSEDGDLILTDFIEGGAA